MKRHDSLAVLSREHHGALILAQLLKKDAPVYKGLPSDPEGKGNYALALFEEELFKHFEAEEQVLIKLTKGTNAELDLLADEIIAAHKELVKLFKGIKMSTDLADHLDQLGRALEAHVRMEERRFFPKVQELCSASILKEIGHRLSD